MQSIITFKKIDPSDSLKDYINKKLAKFDRMLDSPGEAHIVLTVEKIRHIAEITLICDKTKIHAREESENMYSSIDALIDKVKAQIKKSREKTKRHMSGRKKSIKNNNFEQDVTTGSSPGLLPDRIIVESIDDKPMDIEDAVAEIDSGNQTFFVFNNARTQQLNVLYKQKNGKLGLIQPRG